MDLMRRMAFALLVIFLLTGHPSASIQKPEEIAKRRAFGMLVERLSERAGYFGSDNLVSNELSYQHVLGKLDRMEVRGGAYLGVGPDQSFTYIARVKPRIAFMIDIRRDCLLQHLLFKAVFVMSRNRIEYMSLLMGRPIPRDAKKWNGKTIGELADYIDRTPGDAKLIERTRAEVRRRVLTFGVSLSERDLETIDEIYRASGTVRARYSASIAAKIAANILEVPVQTGERVSVGQTLIVLDRRDLEANLRRSEAVRAEAESAIAETENAIEVCRGEIGDGAMCYDIGANEGRGDVVLHRDGTPA